MSDTSSTKLSYKHTLTYQQLACCVLHKTALRNKKSPDGLLCVLSRAQVSKCMCMLQAKLTSCSICHETVILSTVDREECDVLTRQKVTVDKLKPWTVEVWLLSK